MPDPANMLDPSYASLVTIWLAAVGASIGSFLNVVVYRLPRGMNLSYPGSHCPRCGHAIRWRDNVPIFGWLFLRGRCRDCRAPISSRYPLVEALTMSIFVALWYFGNLAQSLPGRQALTADVIWMTYGFHLLLVITLLVAGLIEFDGQQPPLKLFVLAIVVGLIAPILWPSLHPEPIAWSIDEFPDPLPMHIVVGKSFAGIAAGVFLGCLAWPMTGRGGLGPRGRWIAMLELSLIGCFLGWQAAAIVGGEAIGMVAFLRCIGVRKTVSNVSLVTAFMRWRMLS